ncbi:hypothetical protein FA15DRAFT_704790 [Coprinopsis marcescibilis]|uniref:Ricin B lectin domain-containing protein n=1 Tax=Coprinopsis marcescibilis TaxID=230819 RepID=A0A5C3KUF4_COPMA|nr:hypothetical protein FA15DRAFT_704790 [Coprinopsis marcescibilis]
MASLKDGVVYRIISPHYRGVLELNERTKDVSVQDFTASPSQLWKATKSGAYWTLENVFSTDFYLGGHPQTTVAWGVHVVGTITKFQWKVGPAGVSKFPTALKVTVPFSSHGLDASHGEKYPGPPAIFCRLGSPPGHNQIWLFDSEVQPPMLPIVHGKIYKIVNYQSRTVGHLERESGEVRGYSYNEGRNQMWRAVHEGGSDLYLWSFINISNGRSLGVKGGIANKGTLIAGLSESFLWRLVVNPLDHYLVQLYAPFTGLSMDLDGNNRAPGTEMRLWSPNRDRFWRFEEVDDPYLNSQNNINIPGAGPAH